MDELEVINIKKLIRLRGNRGMTIIEMVVVCVLLGIIMLAILSFISYATGVSGAALQNSSTHNEMSLIMMHIKNEVIAAIGGEIDDNTQISALGNSDDIDTRVLLGFNGDRFRIAIRTPGETAETVREYNRVPHMDVSFMMDPDTDNVLIVTLSTKNDPNPRFHYELRDKILLPNLSIDLGRAITDAETISADKGGNSLLIYTPDPLNV